MELSIAAHATSSVSREDDDHDNGGGGGGGDDDGGGGDGDGDGELKLVGARYLASPGLDGWSLACLDGCLLLIRTHHCHWHAACPPPSLQTQWPSEEFNCQFQFNSSSMFMAPFPYDVQNFGTFLGVSLGPSRGLDLAKGERKIEIGQID